MIAVSDLSGKCLPGNITEIMTFHVMITFCLIIRQLIYIKYTRSTMAGYATSCARLVEPDTLQINQHSGFYSCCSIRLQEIISYYKTIGKLPGRVDSSGQFGGYKPGRDSRLPLYIGDSTIDIMPVYFEPNGGDIPDGTPAPSYTGGAAFGNYKDIEFDKLTPFMRKYFTPTANILNLIESIKTKYQIDVKNTCVLFYRGNDKVTENSLCPYPEVIERGQKILEANPNIRFMIQSDETDFLEFAAASFPNHFICYDEIRHIRKNPTATVDCIFANNFEFSQVFLAIMIIMSQCQHVIFGSSGNCPVWVAQFRGSMDNVHQYMRGVRAEKI